MHEPAQRWPDGSEFPRRARLLRNVSVEAVAGLSPGVENATFQGEYGIAHASRTGVTVREARVKNGHLDSAPCTDPGLRQTPTDPYTVG